MSTPSNKAPEVEQALTNIFGFDRRATIEANRCCPPPVGCGGPATEFRDDLSRREYAISGLCQKCQDAIFLEDNDDEDARYAPAPDPLPRPPRYIAKPDEFVTDDYQMFCGQGEAVERKYYRYVGKSGNTWLVADQENAAENVYVTDSPRNNGKQGFGGATLRMPLIEGGEFALVGGWHSNSDALFADTGIDVRDKYRTFVLLAMKRETTDDGTYRSIFREIVYRDTAPTLGRYDRYKEIMAAHPEADYYYMTSHGGSSSGMTDEGRKRWEATKAKANS